MGKQAMELGHDETATVTRAAADPGGSTFCAGLDDGRVWLCDLETQAITPIKAEKGAPISALAMASGQIAWGDETGAAGAVML